MAQDKRKQNCPDEKKTGKKISDTAKLCHSVLSVIKKFAAAYRKKQIKQYKKYAKFKKKTGFWKFKKLKKLKKAKAYSYKPRKTK